MTLSDWIISLCTAAIGIIISIASYFANKWVQSVDETVKEHSYNIKELSKQIVSLQQAQSTQAENLSKTVQAKLSTLQFPYSKISEIEKNTNVVTQLLKDRVFPQIEKHNESLGRIIVLESIVNEQHQRLHTIFSTLKLVVQKIQNQK